ncbi:hypothetical protein CEUSTIGMA_g9513.t1 [Chlamydomonas eustigma]|uniref:Purple acid phosphatase n=1 Tax=Chlamydomonas eustigma TaxID=1157962 RepID=A0A250XG79_9CHLO|nr:hypothetical protein CEUSTIGMA_g9513.t1 [Chlamydomonas eustigma]|eukprot:GAX82085.1 hypothetical protein CEUSTIGMA_g9513.t1 [Chlamydomonas eustigma]
MLKHISSSNNVIFLALLPLALFSATSLAKRGEEHAKRAELYRKLIAEVGTSAFSYHNTTLCDPAIVGSYDACFNAGIKAVGNNDYPLTAPEVSFPVAGEPWGVSLTGPYPDGVTYRISWQSGNYSIGPLDTLVAPDTASMKPVVMLTHNGKTRMHKGTSITYKRAFTDASLQNFDYLSPVINHVVLPNLMPGKKYTYMVGMDNMLSKSFTFKTLPLLKNVYPLRIGLMADAGQTVNTTVTRDHLIASKPHMIINVGDFSYADDYSAANCESPFAGFTTCQPRWDAYAKMWEPAWSIAPVISCAGDHEIENDGINATMSYLDQDFSYPTNYPFLAYASRYPVPGVYSDFGNINNNMYYSTTIAGKIRVIVMNNYYAYGPGTKQYNWAIDELTNKFDRSVTPWLFVMIHAPPYHTYYTHYKEMECFRGVYEDYFYAAGVDLVLNGHVHAYERTHPMYNYQEDTCGAVYITMGDGGNIEGPYRFFVDQLDPLQNNSSFCSQLSYNGMGPNGNLMSNITPGRQWGPSYQIAWNPPTCQTITFQPSNSITGGTPLVLETNSTTLGFCQNSQPTWSAHRDPSFGHGILEMLSDTELTMTWNRNVDGVSTMADSVTLSRVSGCDAKRKSMLKKLRRQSL